MGDDLVTVGILPVGGTIINDDDPNTVESDDFLDDPEDTLPVEVIDVPVATVADDDDDDLLDE